MLLQHNKLSKVKNFIIMVNMIIAFPYYCSKTTYSESFILRLSGILRLVSITSYNQLKKMCSAIRDWFEDRDSNNYSVDTSRWESKIMLINSSR